MNIVGLDLLVLFCDTISYIKRTGIDVVEPAVIPDVEGNA